MLNIISNSSVLPVSDVDTLTAQWAWGNSTGQGVRVAVIDSGIDSQHPALAGGVNGFVSVSEITTATGSNEISYETIPHPDLCGHGTACAGIIRALAPECEIYSVRVLTANLTGTVNVLLAGLQWAIDNKMHICNLSLGTTRPAFFAQVQALVDLATQSNLTLVAAANNRGLPCYPAVCPSVISVGAAKVTDPFTFYHVPQTEPKFRASGIAVKIPWLNQSWLITSGNSFAAPQLSGIVALIRAKHPDLNPFQIQQVLQNLALQTVPI